MSNYRQSRINEDSKKELSLIIRELKDPRIPDFTSVTHVSVTPDLKYAKAYISIMGDEEKVKNCMEALNKGAGFIRREFGKRMKLRITPEIQFVHDDSLNHAFKITEILNKLDAGSDSHE